MHPSQTKHTVTFNRISALSSPQVPVSLLPLVEDSPCFSLHLHTIYWADPELPNTGPARLQPRAVYPELSLPPDEFCPGQQCQATSQYLLQRTGEVRNHHPMLQASAESTWGHHSLASRRVRVREEEGREEEGVAVPAPAASARPAACPRSGS